ncbi:hypothetical protein MtrunA17_Chr5g0411011 [Medicago truncatula]|uniref:Uncharacterized protein n=1 Tax=Medicago truncatula TaxID=3880 RepID=A0A396HQF7_MEDTR|nr:hypothetical protein MtrunA17_Chr5g0411011 [Medicago truncatula]
MWWRTSTRPQQVYETCQYCCPDGITVDQKTLLQLFPMSLVGRAKNWRLALSSGTIKIWINFKINL